MKQIKLYGNQPMEGKHGVFKTFGITKIDSITDTHSTTTIKINPLNPSVFIC
jgi:hypothetical protein